MAGHCAGDGRGDRNALPREWVTLHGLEVRRASGRFVAALRRWTLLLSAKPVDCREQLLQLGSEPAQVVFDLPDGAVVGIILGTKFNAVGLAVRITNETSRRHRLLGLAAA